MSEPLSPESSPVVADLPVAGGEQIATVRHYHQATRHSARGYAPAPGFLDWDSQPDPFRQYEGARRYNLPLLAGRQAGEEGKGPETAPLPEQLQAFFQLPAEQLYSPGAGDTAGWPAAVTADSLSLLCHHAWGVSGWKRDGDASWPVRTVPSSGNLHPAEVSLLLFQPVADGAGEGLPAGLYHYEARDHALECRRLFSGDESALWQQLAPAAWGAVALSSLQWREEWKYGSRAFRYCQLDSGHALGSLRLAAALAGWSACLDLSLGDDDLDCILGLNDPAFAAAGQEYPDMLVWLGRGLLEAGSLSSEGRHQLCAFAAAADWRGAPSPVGGDPVRWPEVEAVSRAARRPAGLQVVLPAAFLAAGPAAGPAERTAPAGSSDTAMPAGSSDPAMPAGSSDPAMNIPAASLIWKRRSARRMQPEGRMRRQDFLRLLRHLLPQQTVSPWDVFPLPPALQMLVVIHNVEGFASGLYALQRSPASWESFSAGQAWPRVAEAGDVPLFCLSAPQDMRKLLSKMSCYQGIGGRGAVTFVMVADMGGILASEGAWGWRRLHWEAGLAGQVLYLEAEASGLGGSGIGCFMDDDSARLAGLRRLEKDRWQTVYHFAVGAVVADSLLLDESAFSRMVANRPAGWLTPSLPSG